MFLKNKQLILLGISSLSIFTISSNIFNEVNASHKKVIIKHNKKQKKLNKHYNNKYVLGTNNYGGQLIVGSLNSLKTGNTSIASGYGNAAVHILKTQRLGGKTFYKINYNTGFSKTAWVYSGNISNTLKRKPHSINLNKFSDKLSNKVSKQYDDKSKQKENNQVPIYLQQMKAQTLKDINNERQSCGIAPLNETSDMDQIAAKRAEQLVSNFDHYDASGNVMYEQVAQNLGISLDGSSGENIAGANLGDTGMSGSPKIYHNNNGMDMADMDNDSMMNYDQDQGNGHRDNILNPDYKDIGIGTFYDQKSGTFYLSEDFRE